MHKKKRKGPRKITLESMIYQMTTKKELFNPCLDVARSDYEYFTGKDESMSKNEFIEKEIAIIGNALILYLSKKTGEDSDYIFDTYDTTISLATGQYFEANLKDGKYKDISVDDYNNYLQSKARTREVKKDDRNA